MRYTLDTEFDGFGGELLSIGLVREDRESIYIVYKHDPETLEPWVRENVVPIFKSIPSPMPGMAYFDVTHIEGASLLRNFFAQDPDVPYICVDWPDDIRYLCSALITGPGTMVSLPRLIFDMIRVDAYPTDLEGCVQHNAYHDARALARKLGFF